MLNRFRSPGRRVGGSLVAALFGVILSLGSVVVLWANEGRADLSKVARDATIVSAGSNGSEARGHMVSITRRPGRRVQLRSGPARAAVRRGGVVAVGGPAAAAWGQGGGRPHLHRLGQLQRAASGRRTHQLPCGDR